MTKISSNRHRKKCTTTSTRADLDIKDPLLTQHDSHMLFQDWFRVFQPPAPGHAVLELLHGGGVLHHHQQYSKCQDDGRGMYVTLDKQQQPIKTQHTLYLVTHSEVQNPSTRFIWSHILKVTAPTGHDVKV